MKKRKKEEEKTRKKEKKKERKKERSESSRGRRAVVRHSLPLTVGLLGAPIDSRHHKQIDARCLRTSQGNLTHHLLVHLRVELQPLRHSEE